MADHPKYPGPMPPAQYIQGPEVRYRIVMDPDGPNVIRYQGVELKCRFERVEAEEPQGRGG